MELIGSADYALGPDVILDGSVTGITNGTEIDITTTMIGSPDFGKVTYTIIAIADNKLYEGLEIGSFDGSSDSTRPVQLNGDLEDIFTRQ